MKSRVNWGWMVPQVLIMVAALALIWLIPLFTGLFDTMLGDRVSTMRTFSNDAQRIQAFINYFIYEFNLLMVLLTVFNLVFLVVEETIPAWYEGSITRFIIQILGNALIFGAFVIWALPFLTSLALAKELEMQNGTVALMRVCLLGGFLFLSVIQLLVAIPSNRRGWLRPKKAR